MSRDILLRILDLARWAPSGDNTQPWRFEIVTDRHVVVHGYDTREWCVYDFDGWASQFAHGILLETLRIAATNFGLEAIWHLRPDSEDRYLVYDVHFSEVYGMPADPLFPFIEKRVVQRRPMQTTPLSESQRQGLTSVIGSGYTLQFFESFAERLKLAKLLWDNAHIRLTCPEAFEVHRQIIEWGSRYSKDRIPEQAVGIDPLTSKLMKWAMKKWSRVDFFNRYLLGTIPPRIQLDAIPALMCSAHVLVRTKLPLISVIDRVHAGVAIQRLWLTVTALGLHLQPEMTPIIFRWYARSGRSISSLSQVNQEVSQMADKLESFIPDGQGELVFLCRVGYSSEPKSRSIRKDLSELIRAGRSN